MPNLSTLSGRLLTQELGSEDSTVLFTDARRIAGINDGIREFADLTECHVKRSSITMAGGTLEYNLLNSTLLTSPAGGSPGTPDFVRFPGDQPLEVWYTDAAGTVTHLAGDDLPEVTVRWLDVNEPGWRSSTISSGMQLPERFYRRIDGGRMFVGFVPVPSTGSSASMKAVVPYVALPPVLSNSTDFPFSVLQGQSVSSNLRPRMDLVPYHQAFVHYAAHQLEKLRRDDQASDRQLQKFMGYVQRYLQSMRKKGGSAVTFARSYFQRSVSAQDPRT